MRRAAAALLLLVAGCAHNDATPVGREFPQNPPTYVELVDADEQVVWHRLHELLAKYHIGIREEHHADGQGYILCRPLSLILPGEVNLDDYHPGEIVDTPGHSVIEIYRLEFYISATASRLVRVWTDAAISADGYGPSFVRLPNLVGANLLTETVRPLAVVKEWRWDHPDSHESLPEGAAVE